MRTKALILTLVPLFAGCKIDILGPGDWDLGWSGTGSWPVPKPNLEVSGQVSVGGWVADDGEATVYFYEPSDTLTPVDSVTVSPDGRYRRAWWGSEPVPDVCDWMARAVLWSGEAGDLEPVVDGQSNTTCGGSANTVAGVTLRVEYAALAVPFVLTGRILSNDEPAQLEVGVPARLQDPYGPGVVLSATSDAEGFYRFETTDARQRFTWCRWLWAITTGPDGVQGRADLWQVYDMQACTDGRTVPDIRFGSYKAITGHLQVADILGVYRPAGTAEAKVTLVDPTDSLPALGPVETLDDGSFHMWWSMEDGFPGCDFLIRVEIDDGPPTFASMIESTQGCAPGVERWVYVD